MDIYDKIHQMQAITAYRNAKDALALALIGLNEQGYLPGHVDLFLDTSKHGASLKEVKDFVERCNRESTNGCYRAEGE